MRGLWGWVCTGRDAGPGPGPAWGEEMGRPVGRGRALGADRFVGGRSVLWGEAGGGGEASWGGKRGRLSSLEGLGVSSGGVMGPDPSGMGFAEPSWLRGVGWGPVGWAGVELSLGEVGVGLIFSWGAGCGCVARTLQARMGFGGARKPLIKG